MISNISSAIKHNGDLAELEDNWRSSVSNTYSSTASILAMLRENYTEENIAQALADLYAIYSEGNIGERKQDDVYRDMKTLLEAKR